MWCASLVRYPFPFPAIGDAQLEPVSDKYTEHFAFILQIPISGCNEALRAFRMLAE